jgi:hypothetical protein
MKITNMSIIMKSTLLLIILFTFLSCNTHKEIFVDNPQVLSFGSSGGFTNQSIEYRLHSDGKLWKYRGLGKDSSLLKHLKSSRTKKVFNEFYKLGLDSLQLNKPGNMNVFIKIKSKILENKILYSKGSNDVPTEVNAFYSSLNDLVKTQ